MQSAADLEARSLTNSALKTFLEENLHRELKDWPHALWDFDALTLAAFYYHPDLAVARAQWATVRAGEITAGERPNPTISVAPAFNNQIPGAFSPWIVAASLDVPVETAGKRKRRLEQSQYLSEAARINLATIAWHVRGELRSSLIATAAAQQRTALLQRQISIQENIVKLLGQQAQAGAIAQSELSVSRVALAKLRLDLADAQSQLAANRARVAEALGVPLAAADQAELSFDPLKDLMSETNLTTADVRRAALQSRTDILGALAEYAAAQSALQLEIARQYPDLHLGPGYSWNSGSAGDNQWELGLTVTLPVLNQNQGAIAEAAARREEAAAKFNSVQAKALAEIERAVAIFRAGEKNSTALRALAEMQKKQLETVESQFNAGGLERIDLLNAQLESVNADLLQLDAQTKLQSASAALEDAVQRPLKLMNLSELEPPPTKRKNEP